MGAVFVDCTPSSHASIAGWVTAATRRSSNRPSARARTARPYDGRQGHASAPCGMWRWFSQNAAITSCTWRSEEIRRVSSHEE
ncbi:hypothetical protein [Nocardioides sp. TF02-7]|uniref:hypothetical protein n=1 Tax=Nocardioides sp. TF02-7 TaxID=2917724 RepID=UPI0023DBDE98|nr:hypothetical protein [Nocardioides sp. TF02-7]